MKNIIAAIGLAIGLASSAGAATLVNGSLTGPVGSSIVPTGWSINSITPDTTSAASQPFGFNANPGDSPDGGTWVGLARNTSLFESFGQTVSDFVIGTTYTISWYSANTGCCSGGYSAAAEILFDLDGSTALTGTTLSQGEGWILESFDFTATSTSHRLDFRLGTGAEAYMGIDGISLAVAGTPVVPLPASGLLLMAGMGGLTLMRRRK